MRGPVSRIQELGERNGGGDKSEQCMHKNVNMKPTILYSNLRKLLFLKKKNIDALKRKLPTIQTSRNQAIHSMETPHNQTVHANQTPHIQAINPF